MNFEFLVFGLFLFAALMLLGGMFAAWLQDYHQNVFATLQVGVPVLMVVLMLAFGTGCASTSVELMLGGKLRDGGVHGSGPTASLRVKHEFSDRWFCEYEHISHLLVGPPFSPASDEDTLDHAGCGVRFGGPRR
jgi:hypothetical protein